MINKIERENMDNSTHLLMEAREYAIYSIRMCLIFQNHSFPDNYNIHDWESKARSLNLTNDDCSQFKSSNVLNCSHLLVANEYAINFLSTLESLCATIKPNPTSYTSYWIITFGACITLLIFYIILKTKSLPSILYTHGH